jgi:hypothetical protein
MIGKMCRWAFEAYHRYVLRHRVIRTRVFNRPVVYCAACEEDAV